MFLNNISHFLNIKLHDLSAIFAICHLAGVGMGVMYM